MHCCRVSSSEACVGQLPRLASSYLSTGGRDYGPSADFSLQRVAGPAARVGQGERPGVSWTGFHCHGQCRAIPLRDTAVQEAAKSTTSFQSIVEGDVYIRTDLSDWSRYEELVINSGPLTAV